MAVILVPDHLVDPGTGQQRLVVAVEDHLNHPQEYQHQQEDLQLLEDQDHQEDQLHQDQGRVEDQEEMEQGQERRILNLQEDNPEEREIMAETREDQEETLVARETSLPAAAVKEDVLTVFWKLALMLVQVPMLKYLADVSLAALNVVTNKSLRFLFEKFILLIAGVIVQITCHPWVPFR